MYIVNEKKRQKMEMNRVFAMANKETFKIKAINSFVDRYLDANKISIDPFSRNCSKCTYTNDLNPETSAQYHMKAESFLRMLVDQGIHADLVIFDPPYSTRQCKRSYENFGYEFTQKDSQQVIRWTIEKNIISTLLIPGGIFLHFGWHSNGMGVVRNFRIQEILLVSHGGAKNDTICMAEKRDGRQMKLF